MDVRKFENLVMNAEGLLHFCDAHPLHWVRGESPLAKSFREYQEGLRAAVAAVAAVKAKGAE